MSVCVCVECVCVCEQLRVHCHQQVFKGEGHTKIEIFRLEHDSKSANLLFCVAMQFLHTLARIQKWYKVATCT